jgi:hypothetical protein
VCVCARALTRNYRCAEETGHGGLVDNDFVSCLETKVRYSPPSGAEVKDWVELYLYSPIRLHGVVLSYGEHRDKFTFTFKVK